MHASGVRKNGRPRAERTRARLTRKRLFVRMRPNVFFQLALKDECCWAQVAGVWPYVCVNESMRVQITLLRKRRFADFTDVRFNAGVNTKVRLQMARLCKRCLANVACERLFPGVCTQVHPQVLVPAECSWTITALVGFLAVVHTNMAV